MCRAGTGLCGLVTGQPRQAQAGKENKSRSFCEEKRGLNILSQVPLRQRSPQLGQ